MFQYSGIGKVDAIYDYLEQCLNYPEKIVIFCHHVKVIGAICKKLEKKQAQLNKQKENLYTDERPLFVKIDGSTNDKQRENAVHLFQTPLTENQRRENLGGTRFIILSITSAAEGLNLTESSTVIFGEMYWTPKAILQAEDRVHRIKQKNAVNIVFMIGRGTIDSLIFKKVNAKIKSLNKVLDNTLKSNFKVKSKNLAEPDFF